MRFDLVEDPTTRQCQALRELGSKDIDSVVSAFTAPVVEKFHAGVPEDSEDGLESELWQSWHDVMALAANLHHEASGDRSQEALAEFCIRVQALGPLTREDGARCVVWDDSVWDEMPIFGAYCRELIDCISPNGEPTDQERERLTNYYAFNARLANAGQRVRDATGREGIEQGMLLHGLWMLRSAFEDAAATETPAIDIHCACMWLRYGAPLLHAHCVKGEPYEDRVGMGGELVRDRGWWGFCMDRWDFWCSQVRAANEELAGKVSDECSAALRDAVAAVNRIGKARPA